MKARGTNKYMGQMLQPIHPFPARMAPEVALARLEAADRGAVVLDPMSGSGTVVRHATLVGHRAIGFDTDPLAVLMTRVWTTPIDTGKALSALPRFLEFVRGMNPSQIVLPAIDDDTETANFVDYWFGRRQQESLRRLASALECFEPEDPVRADLYRVALSRIIITKDRGASLARDVSHSRPHKAWDDSDFDVLPAFERSVRRVAKLLAQKPPEGNASVELGDARDMSKVHAKTVDLVLTSPPYLNAIDYMRGHRMSLVWFGHRVRDLRLIRSVNIGAERAADGVDSDVQEPVRGIVRAMCGNGELGRRRRRMVVRYAGDLLRMMAEIARVLRAGGQAILVVGNSCLKGTFVHNAAGVSEAARFVGLQWIHQEERDLPSRNRYLPTPVGRDAPLGKRMRTESILTFAA